MKWVAKKSLGQHFLLNPSTTEKIVQLAGVTSTDCVLEIGPGPGTLTRSLAEHAGTLVVVEKDFRFATSLKEIFATQKSVTILEEDFLDLDLKKIFSAEERQWKAVGNLPYNVATEILFRLFEFRSFFKSFHLMFQREVAERIVALPGSKNYSALSVMSQVFSDNKIVLRLPPGSFTPPPKVHSAIVRFELREPKEKIEDESVLQKTVASAFQKRRKMIQNALEVSPDILKEAGIAPEARPETVSAAQFIRLSNQISLK